MTNFESKARTAFTGTSTFRRQDPRGNILVLLMDDVGLDFMSTYSTWNIRYAGFPAVQLAYALIPEIQLIAREGVKFFNAHTMANCSPTRACMLSGRYPFRHGIGNALREISMPENFPPLEGVWELSVNHETDELLIGELTEPPGYESIVCGKWHLGMPDNGTPPTGVPWDTSAVDLPATLGSGWAHPALAGLKRAELTFQNLDKEPITPGEASGDTNDPGYHNFYWASQAIDGTVTVTQVDGTYHTTKSRSELEDWINTEAQEPFIIYWAVSAIHSPWGAFPHNTEAPAATSWSGCMPPEGEYHQTSTEYPMSGFGGDGAPLDANQDVYNSTRAALESIDWNIGELRRTMGNCVEGTATAAAVPTTRLEDSAATFITDGVEVGQKIRNVTDRSQAEVVTVDSETQITHTELTNGVGNEWDVADVYTIDRSSLWDRTNKFVLGDNGTQNAPLLAMQDQDAQGGNIGWPYASMLEGGAGRFKGSVYEGGTRVPMFVSGPAVSGMNRNYYGFVDVVDIYATIRHIARTRYVDSIFDGRTIDGISFLPILQNAAAQDAAGSRQTSFTERFEPIGDPANANTAGTHVRDRSYAKRYAGTGELAGVFKLIRKLGETDELYRISDADYNENSIPVTGTADAGGTQTRLVDTSKTFLTSGVETGWAAYNEDLDEAERIIAVSETQLTTTALSGGTWAAGHTYRVQPDVYEQVELPHDPGDTFRDIYVTMATELLALLTSEGSIS